MNIELHIERLILDGLQVEARNRTALQAAVESELTRLLAASGVKAELLPGCALPGLRASEIHITNPMGAARLGNNIAQAVYGSIGAAPAPNVGKQAP